MHNFEGSSEWIFQTHNCCSCGRPLKEATRYINMVCTNFIAEWKYPISGNLSTGAHGRAVAVLCDTCVTDKTAIIVNVLEYQGEKIIYHCISDLEEVE